MIAIAKTPSLNATMRANSIPLSSRCRGSGRAKTPRSLLSVAMLIRDYGRGAPNPAAGRRGCMLRYTPLGYEHGRGDLNPRRRAAQRAADGLRGLVGAGARLRDLGDRPGLGPARADRARALGRGAGPGRARRPASAPPRRRAPTRRSRSPARCSQKGASAATALAFQFASTNLVWELGLVLWVLIGWQFTLAEYVGGIVLIALMAALLRALRLAAARGARRASTPQAADAGARSTTARGRRGLPLARAARPRSTRGPTSPTTSAATGQMLWKEITIGFLLAGLHRPARRRLLQRPVRHRRAAPCCRRSRT